MRILYLPAYFYPEKAASSYLGENRNQAFADAGFDIIAYAPTPCRGITKEEREVYCSKEHRTEIMYDGDKRTITMEQIERALTDTYGDSDYARECGCYVENEWLSIRNVLATISENI